MAYIVRLKIKIINPSWNKEFIDFLRNFVVPLIPFFRRIASGYREVRDSVHAALEFLFGIIILILAIPLGLISMAMLFGIPVILFCVAMGWIN